MIASLQPVKAVSTYGCFTIPNVCRWCCLVHSECAKRSLDATNQVGYPGYRGDINPVLHPNSGWSGLAGYHYVGWFMARCMCEGASKPVFVVFCCLNISYNLYKERLMSDYCGAILHFLLLESMFRSPTGAAVSRPVPRCDPRKFAVHVHIKVIKHASINLYNESVLQFITWHEYICLNSICEPVMDHRPCLPHRSAHRGGVFTSEISLPAPWASGAEKKVQPTFTKKGTAAGGIKWD